MPKPRMPLDLYKTPQAATRMLLKEFPIEGSTVFECCAADGAIAGVLRESGCQVKTADINPDYGTDAVFDATLPLAWEDVVAQVGGFDWVVTNPPFKHSAEILINAYKHAHVGVFMLLNITFAEPCRGRNQWLADHADQ